MSSAKKSSPGEGRRFSLRWPVRAMRSIRFRMAALFVGIFGATLVVFTMIVFGAYSSALEKEFDAALFNHAVDTAQAIDVDFFGSLSLGSDPLTSGGKIHPFALGKAFVQVRGADRRIIARSRNLGQTDLPLEEADVSAVLRNGAAFRTLQYGMLPFDSREGRAAYRQISYLVERPFAPRLILQIAVPTTLLLRQRVRLVNFFLFSVPIVLVVAGVGGFFLSGRAIAPVVAIIEKTRSIGASRLSDRVPVPESRDELHALAVTINSLLDRLEKAFAHQERFVADASHQLKTPLAILKGELDVFMRNPRSPEETQQFLESASQEIDLLSKMVGDLLTLARMDAGKAALSTEPVRVDEIALETVSRLEPLARTAGIRLMLNLEGDDFVAQGDRELLAAMLRNLVENAIKYSKVGSLVQVEVRDAGAGLALVVRDDGPGMAPELLPKIFDRFQRLNAGPSSPAGSGLGLPIARQIAEAHGGSLEAQSAPGQGSQFTARIKKV